MHHPTNRIMHTTAFVTPVVEHWPEREIAQCVHPMKDRSDDISHHERTLLPQSYISLPCSWNETKEMFYLMMHSTHFIYSCMASDICQRITQRLAASVLLYAAHPTKRMEYTMAFVTQAVEPGWNEK